jgi:hypothetical protein
MPIWYTRLTGISDLPDPSSTFFSDTPAALWRQEHYITRGGFLCPRIYQVIANGISHQPVTFTVNFPILHYLYAVRPAILDGHQIRFIIAGVVNLYVRRLRCKFPVCQVLSPYAAMPFMRWYTVQLSLPMCCCK